MTTPGTPGASPVRGPGRSPHGGQRFGHVTGRRPSAGTPGGYLVRDDETGITYPFSFADIVTEGLRTIRTGEHVRFLIDNGHASYVIRLDLPDIEAYYS